MRTNTPRTNTPRIAARLLAAALLVATGTGAVAGCGTEKAGSRTAGTDDSRARQVADAWDGSAAAEAWGKGYYPLDEAVQLPENAFRSDADKRAYTTQNFVLSGELPTTAPKDGQVKWKDGGSLMLPLMGVRRAYESLARGSNDGPHLTVTGAEPGETTLTTSRGPATVPAWLFTLRGYDTPLKRVALSPSKLPRPPIEPVGGTPTDELMSLSRLVEVAPDGRSVTVPANHGACDDGPAVDVRETDGSVVLSASIVGTKDGACPSVMLGKKVTVELDRPLGDRILLDAFTGRPVPFGTRGGSPSWS